MSSTATSSRKAAAADTLQFDFLLGDKYNFTFKDLAARTGISDSTLERLWEDKSSDLHISGHEYNAGEGLRNTKRVVRPFAVRLLVKSARYTAEEKLLAVTSCAKDFNAEDAERIAAAFLAEARRKKGL